MGSLFSKGNKEDKFQVLNTPPARASFLGQPHAGSKKALASKSSSSSSSKKGNRSSNRRSSLNGITDAIRSSVLITTSPNAGDTPLYSSQYVGSKAHNLLKLRRTGVNVPPFMVISSAEANKAFTNATEKLGVSILDWIKSEDINPLNFEKFRDEISKTELSDVALEELGAFIVPTKTYAVRSSSNLEDGSDSAFAGRFATILNVPGNPALIASAVRLCWLSCLKDDLLPNYRKANNSVPQMAVVVMEQIVSDASGVFFQANPITGSTSTYVINSLYGQGEGIVGGKCEIDEVWVSSTPPHAIKKQVIGHKTKKIDLNPGDKGGGTNFTDISQELQDIPVLNQDKMNQLLEASKMISAAYTSPQDIEFAFVGDELFILQSRPITTRCEDLVWHAPDVGLWRLNAHMSSPMSKIYSPIWQKGWSEGVMFNSDLVGNGFSACDTCDINGYGYYAIRTPGPKEPPKKAPPKFLMKTILYLTGKKAMKQATEFWTKKQYLSFMNTWDSALKPDWVKRHREIQAIDPSQLSNEDLLKHFKKCHEHFAAAWYGHCTYSLQNMLPVGWFLQMTYEWTDKKVSTEEASLVFEGYSPCTTGIYGEFPDAIKSIADNEAVNSTIENAIKNGLSSDVVQEAIAVIRQHASQLISDLEHRLVSGYDPADATMKETPTVLLMNIKSAIESAKNPNPTPTKKADELAAKIRQSITESKRAEWDILLQDARSVHRLRDERALYTDLWAAGILHLTLLECGKRLVAQNPKLHNPYLAMEATFEEIIALLETSSLDTKDNIFTEWGKRAQYRKTSSIRDAPDLLGGNDIVITRDYFPSKYQGMSFASTMAVVRMISTPPSGFEDKYAAGGSSKGIIYGIPGSAGTCEGKVVVVKSGDDLALVQKGDIVVTESPSSLINLVIPLGCGAIVCDFGGSLSHASICCREAGIPCVIGCKVACTNLKTGDNVSVDGTNGVVKVIA